MPLLLFFVIATLAKWREVSSAKPLQSLDNDHVELPYAIERGVEREENARSYSDRRKAILCNSR